MSKTKEICGIIPARYGSTRFPGKALALINGVPMVQLVYQQCLKAASLSDVIIATDDSRIADVVAGFGGKYVLTRTDHVSGTDRCQEAISNLGFMPDFIINIQGDEPFINPAQIDQLAEVLTEDTQLATLVHTITSAEDLFAASTAKVVCDDKGNALLFSRNPIPFVRNYLKEDWLKHHTFLKHIGIYAYRRDILADITKLPAGSLEIAESLEQLRWLEAGYRIKVAHTPYDSYGIDTPEDLTRVSALFATK